MPIERPEDKAFLHRNQLSGDIEFNNVHFSYPDQNIPVLCGVSCKIKAGEKVAIIGRIGSGKSTLEKLLLGFYEPNSGSINIDGIDIGQIDPADLRRQIGYLPQSPHYFYGSLRENIVIGRPHIDQQKIIDAAKVTALDEFVNRHPAGFDMQIGERGERLSGGQRQSVAIARAVIDSPPIMIFDEPCNSMDNTSEENFKKRIAEILPDKTLIMVTHKSSLLTLVDRIIVMDKGKIIADGTKESVLAALREGRIATT